MFYSFKVTKQVFTVAFFGYKACPFYCHISLKRLFLITVMISSKCKGHTMLVIDFYRCGSSEFVVQLVICIQDVCPFTLFFISSIILSSIKHVREILPNLNDFTTSSVGISCHALLTHCNTSSLFCACFFPDGVYVKGPFTKLMVCLITKNYF